MKIYQNEQEVFDAVWAHIKDQQKPCMAPGGGCLYFNEEDGTSCAIGGILPPEIDRKALDDLEGDTSIGNVLRSTNPEARNVQEVFKNVSPYFLGELQNLHDGTLRKGGFQTWRYDMTGLAMMRGLQVPKD